MVVGLSQRSYVRMQVVGFDHEVVQRVRSLRSWLIAMMKCLPVTPVKEKATNKIQ
jgi:hypothetical protein